MTQITNIYFWYLNIKETIISKMGNIIVLGFVLFFASFVVFLSTLSINSVQMLVYRFTTNYYIEIYKYSYNISCICKYKSYLLY